MLSNIKTSKSNKEIVTTLTQKMNLGAENIVARLAFSYSLNINGCLSLAMIQDSNGKEYSAKVLFGGYEDIYVALIATKYNIHSTDKNVSKYIKMHIDDGLQLIKIQIERNHSLSGIDFLINEIEKGLLKT